MKGEAIAGNLNGLVQHYLYEVREHDYNIFNLILTEPRWRETECARERKRRARIKFNTLQWVSKHFVDYYFQIVWLLLVISPQNTGYRIKIYETQNTTPTTHNIPNHSYRNICIIRSGMLQNQMISHQHHMHTKTASNEIQLHWQCLQPTLIIS